MTKKQCSKCGNKFNHLTMFKGEQLCFRCITSKTTPMPNIPPSTENFTINTVLTLKEADYVRKRTKELGLSRGSYVRELIRIDMDRLK